MIVLDLQAAMIVEDRGFKRLIATLDPRYQLPNHHKLMRDLLPVKYESCVESLLHLLEDIKSCSLTTDVWTSRAQESFIIVTSYFTNIDWQLLDHT